MKSMSNPCGCGIAWLPVGQSIILAANPSTESEAGMATANGAFLGFVFSSMALGEFDSVIEI
jgi:hypothetical protein